MSADQKAVHTATPIRFQEAADPTLYQLIDAKDWVIGFMRRGTGGKAEREELLERVAFIVRAVNAHADLVSLVKDAQSILAAHLPPDGISEKECISQLLGLLDSPQSRAALTKAAE